MTSGTLGVEQEERGGGTGGGVGWELKKEALGVCVLPATEAGLPEGVMVVVLVVESAVADIASTAQTDTTVKNGSLL